jgi:hypothetical protein
VTVNRAESGPGDRPGPVSHAQEAPTPRLIVVNTGSIKKYLPLFHGAPTGVDVRTKVQGHGCLLQLNGVSQCRKLQETRRILWKMWGSGALMGLR